LMPGSSRRPGVQPKQRCSVCLLQSCRCTDLNNFNTRPTCPTCNREFEKFRGLAAHRSSSKHCRIAYEEGRKAKHAAHKEDMTAKRMKRVEYLQRKEQVMLLSRSAERQRRFDEMFSLFQQWRADPFHGNGDPSGRTLMRSRTKYQGKMLGAWLKQVKHKFFYPYYNNGNTDPLNSYETSKIQGLVDAGHIENENAKRFDQMYGLLLKWRDDPLFGNGQHCNVPTASTYRNPSDWKHEGQYLGNWLRTQRLKMGGRRGRGITPLEDDERSRLQVLINSGHLFFDPECPSREGVRTEDAKCDAGVVH